MPSPFVQEVLVKSILVTLSDAVAADNFTVLHAKISKPFREQFPPEKLRAVFPSAMAIALRQTVPRDAASPHNRANPSAAAQQKPTDGR